ncbi:MAG: TVP38/TMEM64 family protein [Tissierellia bacterium]|nr:TVP38/TMEM64 family protein [Tissierellia bacterium]
MNGNLKKHASKLILIAILLIGALLYFFNPRVNQTVNQIAAMFATGDFTIVRDFIDEYGAYAMLVSAGLMIFQSLAAPLPAFLITFANANLFGWWQGAILSWSSAMIGAALCFFISRILGRDIVEKLTSKAGLESLDEFFDKYGKHSILIARLLPFMSFDIVSYAAGLTSMNFWSFFVATGLGQLPATIIYSYVGGMLSGGARLLVTGLLILFALSILVVLIRKIYVSRNTDLSRTKGNEKA